MRLLKIFLLSVFILQSSLLTQIKNTDKSSTDKTTSRQFEITSPRIDLSGFDILKQIEPYATTGTIYNDQMLEGAVDPNRYIVGPNDIFALGVWGILNQPLPIAVSPEGSLIIPSVGEVNVNGLTLTEAKKKVIDKVNHRYISADITLTLISPRRFTITVTGVGQGTYPTSAILRASAIIAYVISDSVSLLRSGTSPNDKWNFALRNITLKRKSGQQIKIDLYRYYATQDEKYNPFLLEGDVINIPKYDWEAKFLSVYGAVQFPGLFEYIEGDDLETAIQLVRGGTSMANLDSILISRLDIGGNSVNNFYVKYQENKNFKLEPNDRVVVLPRYDQRRDFKVFVLGEVVKPGLYPVTINTMKITDVINLAGGFTQNAYLPISEVYRRVDSLFVQMKSKDSAEFYFTQRLNDVVSNKDEKEQFEQDTKFKLGRVNVDFEKLYKNKDLSQDITLRNGDIIYIGDNKKQIYVYGQVNKPGFVPFKEGADAEYYIQQAGGYADRADEDGMRVIKFKTREWLEPDGAKIESNDFVYVPKLIKRDFAYDIDLIAKVAAVVSSVVTLTILILQSQK